MSSGQAVNPVPQLRQEMACPVSPRAQHSAADAPGEVLAAAMADDWRRGERRRAEDYLDRHPELLDPPEGAIRLIYEEVCLRREQGEDVGTEELHRRFPDWAGELA